MRWFLLILILFSTLTGTSQIPYWQQEVNFSITVQLNDQEHTLDGFEKIEYINHSPDTLNFIWMHVWPNAFRTDKTAFSDQLLRNGRTDFYFSEKEDRGYINRLEFRVQNTLAKTEDHPQHIDIVKILLPQPLLPGASIEITTPFHIQLPKNYSRGGHSGKSYQITQWYPKPAVYDHKGWHPMPYLEQGEFYSEFGNYDVRITLPENYVVMSTGILETESEKSWLLQRKNERPTLPTQTQPKPIGENKNTPTQQPRSKALKTLHFTQKQVHDFAWFADKKLIVQHDTLQLTSGQTIELYSCYYPESAPVWRNSIQMMKRALRYRNELIGAYPYNHMTAVEAVMGFEGGMEYPCITSISPVESESELEEVLAHEIGHNWFQAAIGSNERDYSWMDEGINSYYDNRYRTSIETNKKHQSFNFELDDILLASMEKQKKDQPLSTASDQFTDINYFLTSYTKGAAFIALLEKELTTPVFDKAMQFYYGQWKFKHPDPEQFQQTFEQYTGKDLSHLFAKLHQNGPLLPDTTKKIKLTPFIGFNKRTTHAIIVSPLAGFNMYDGLMPGILVSNYTLPPTRFQFLVAPLYGVKSKTLNGIARMSYTLQPKQHFERITLAVSGMKFHSNDFTDTAQTKYLTGFSKFVPGIKLVFKEKDPLSSRERFLQWKTFLFWEDALRFRSDTFPNGNRFTKINKETKHRYLNQLRYVVQDDRVLYPYRAEFLAEQAQDFVRLAFTGNYYFNYNEKLGAGLRFFAGKFLYIGSTTLSKRFRNDAYHLNMTGPKGYEDYTYSNYFIGRSEFEGFPNQQIMIRDGGFKIRTDLLANKIGKSDDWLIAMNWVTDIPDQINILNVLPVKIPVKIFFDLGTNAELWKDKQSGRLLFDAGLQFTLLKDVIDLYVPLFYSRVYRDYIQSTIPERKLLNTISFSIQIQNLTLKKLDRRLPF